MEERNPYAPPQAPVVAADGTEPRLPRDADALEYAGFWWRVLAAFLDGLIMIPLSAASRIA